MTDSVAIAIVAGLVTIAQGLMTLWGGRATRAKVAEVHNLVDGGNTENIRQIEALKGEVGKLNENSTNSTPQSGGAVILQHGQVIVPTKEPEVKG